MDVNTGWICPRCADVNSPSVTKCGCKDYKSGLQAPFKVGSPITPNDYEMFKVHPNSVTYTSGSIPG